MTKILEKDLFIEYVGKQIQIDRLEEIGHLNGNGYHEFSDCLQYYIPNIEYSDKIKYQQLFNLTPTLIENWNYNGIDFSIYLHIKNGMIVQGSVFKYKETSFTSPYRSNGRELCATQQELRIVQRILNYITE